MCENINNSSFVKKTQNVHERRACFLLISINFSPIDLKSFTSFHSSHRDTTSLVQDEDKHEGLMPVDEYSDFPLLDNDARTSAVNLSYKKRQLLDLKMAGQKKVKV